MSNPRVIIVGDVHGCIDEARALLKKCNFRQGTDRLIFVGDLVGKGPDSFAVIRLVRSMNAECVMGNWDHFVCNNLAYIANDYKRAHPGATSIPSLTEEELTWLKSLPYTIDVPDHNVLVVHAGLVPGVAIADQKLEDMMNMRNLLEDGKTASKDIKVGTPWAKQWRGPRTVVFGHDAQRGFQREPFAIGLDTGAVYGRQLTALILPSREICEVPSAKVYSDPGPKKPPTILQRIRSAYHRVDPDGTHLPLFKTMIRLLLVFALIRILYTVVSRLPS